MRHDRLRCARRPRACTARPARPSRGARRSPRSAATSAAASASRTVCSSAGGSTGLCTYLNACSRTAFSSVSGASSDVITTTRGRVFGGAELREQIEAVHARHPDVEQQQVEASSAERLQRLDAVFGHRRREAGVRQDLCSTCRVVLSSSTTRILFMTPPLSLRRTRAGGAADGASRRRQPGGGERCVEPVDLRAAASRTPLRASSKSPARAVCSRSAAACRRRRADGRDRALQARARPAAAPRRRAVSAPDRCAAATRGQSARKSARLLEQLAIAARVCQRGTLVEDAGRSTCGDRRPARAPAPLPPNRSTVGDQLVDVDRLRRGSRPCPAARQRSRSPCIACAVSAIDRQRRPPCRLPLADRLRSPRSRPSRASARPSARRRTARWPRVDRLDGLRPFSTAFTRVPALLQQRRHQLAVHGVVLGDQDVQRRSGPRAERARPPARCAVPRRHAEERAPAHRAGRSA